MVIGKLFPVCGENGSILTPTGKFVCAVPWMEIELAWSLPAFFEGYQISHSVLHKEQASYCQDHNQIPYSYQLLLGEGWPTAQHDRCHETALVAPMLCNRVMVHCIRSEMF